MPEYWGADCYPKREIQFRAFDFSPVKKGSQRFYFSSEFHFVVAGRVGGNYTSYAKQRLGRNGFEQYKTSSVAGSVTYLRYYIELKELP